MTRLFQAAPFTKLQIRLNIYRNLKALRRAYQATGCDEVEDNTVVAFVSSPVVKTDGILAEIHLCREDLSLDTIVHECQHASLHLTTYMQLDLENRDAEELFAETTAHIVCQVQAAVEELRRAK
jgi:hypothetical protein